jgi:hypothetical protein
MLPGNAGNSAEKRPVEHRLGTNPPFSAHIGSSAFTAEPTCLSKGRKGKSGPDPELAIEVPEPIEFIQPRTAISCCIAIAKTSVGAVLCADPGSNLGYDLSDRNLRL